MKRVSHGVEVPNASTISTLLNPSEPGSNPTRQTLPAPSFPESSLGVFDRIHRCCAVAAALLRRGQSLRRNAVTAVGVRLIEAPGAPSRGEVQIRIPSSQLRSAQLRSARWRVARGDIHLSGDIRRTRLADGSDRACARAPSAPRRARGIADCTMTGLAAQAYGKSGTRMAPDCRRSLAGDLVFWKDPL